MRPVSKRIVTYGTAVIVCLLFGQHADAQKGRRVSFRINDKWKFTSEGSIRGESTELDDSSWQTVNIPHTWNVEDVLDDIPGYRRGVSWYRRELHVDRAFEGKRVFIFFEGANQVAEVFVNGKPVGKHIGGYTAFSVDITQFVKIGASNLLAVRVDNSLNKEIPPTDGDFNMYGGIYRDVRLVAVEPVHLGTTEVASTNIAITTPEVSADAATVEIVGAVVNSGSSARTVEVTSSILDPRGRKVATASSTMRVQPRSSAQFKQNSIRVTRPMLWSPDAPNLYRVQTTMREKRKVIDESTNPLGFRWFKFDSENGFFLNGKHVKLRGTNRHQDRAGLGNALTDDLHVRDLEIIKENGFNFLRLAHYPQDPAVLYAADRLGIMIWEEIPIVNQFPISAAFNENAKNMLREMIRHHRNHPSIIIWGYMNEVFLPRPKSDDVVQATLQLARELETICRTEDPSRATAIAFDWGARDLYNSSGLGEVTQVVGWNLYHGWYYEEFQDFGKFLDEEHRNFPGRPLIVSEYGANGDRRVHSIAPKRFDSSIEWQRMFHEAYLPQIEHRPFIAGSAIWNQFDFGSEFRGETIPHINQKGIYTFDRQPKDVAFLYRANYSRDPVVHIAVRDWPRRSGPKTQTVTVYSNLERVELLHNGTSQGVRTIGSDRIAGWTVNFVPGRNSLTAVERSPSRSVRDQAVVEYIDPASTQLIAVNCGANTEVIDAAGVIWQADVPAIGERAWSVRAPDTKSIDRRVNIFGTPDDAIYQTMGEGASTYKFAVPDGRYEVELRFAEPKFKAAGERVFGVKINGAPAIDKFDPFAAAGYMMSVARRLTVTATAGSGIEIELVSITDLPIVSGIRLQKN